MKFIKKKKEIGKIFIKQFFVIWLFLVPVCVCVSIYLCRAELNQRNYIRFYRYVFSKRHISFTFVRKEREKEANIR